MTRRAHHKVHMAAGSARAHVRLGAGFGAALLAVALLGGCDRARGGFGAQSYNYAGYAFKGAVRANKTDRAEFAVSVRGAQRGLVGAQEAARIAANRYCIEQYGSSDISWQGQGPDTEAEAVALAPGGQLEMRGRCAAW